MISTLVTTGLAVGGSVGIAQIFELPESNPVVQAMYKTRHRAVITSTVISVGIGMCCGPVPAVISECINFPLALYKSKKVRKYLEQQQPYEMPTNTEVVGDLSSLTINQLKGIIL